MRTVYEPPCSRRTSTAFTLIAVPYDNSALQETMQRVHVVFLVASPLDGVLLGIQLLLQSD
jgi:hypothetical protein